MLSNLILDAIQNSQYFQNKLACLLDKKRVSFGGMVGSSISAYIAALASDYPNILVITSSADKAAALKLEIAFFSGGKPAFFPAPDTIPGEKIAPSKELIGERLAIFNRWRKNERFVAVAPVKAVMWRTSRGLESIKISEQQNIRMGKIIEELVRLGYKRFDIVGERGEFSVRGGIIDIFPLNQDQPVRIELLGDEIESIRTFNAFTQRSIEKITAIVILPAHESFEVPLFEHLPKGSLIILDEGLEIERAVRGHLEEKAAIAASLQYLDFSNIKQEAQNFMVAEFSSFLIPGGTASLSRPESYINRFDAIPSNAILISQHAARLQEEVEARVIKGALRAGFRLADQLTVLTDKELFGEKYFRRESRARAGEGVASELLADLKIGDYVVHENYGIGIYQGMENLEIEDEIFVEYVVIEFARGDKVFVPPSQAGMVEKYAGGGDFTPQLSRLGTRRWELVKGKVKKALKDMTKDLLEIYGSRQGNPGFAFPPDDIWQTELEGTFPFEETPDQRKAIAETKQDMESSRPMDRLICGDVGYGKTEVAIRAAAKATAAGKQVAVLVPTTILAEQHYNNFKSRFAGTPFNVAMLSRFKSKKEQVKIVKSLAEGGIDIVIGTHRLFSRDIQFKDLGLLVLDEEQRFGVAHKERLKKLKKTVDVLTLTATPIPRTLYLSLAGAREMSIINTPPIDRSPIRTYVLPWSEAVIKEAIRREMDRGGQIFFLHNVVESIEGMAAKIRRLVPSAKVALGHGQMAEKQLEKTMLQFLDGKYDVLVCTTIIESGLDIANVNTLLVNDADRFGLSQLYQIRGRVGRSAPRAYAYLFYQPERIMTATALERLKTIQEFTALGSGYKLAMRDLEIRGAGNLLGAQQSGHVMEVGFDLYCEMLEKAVLEAKGRTEPLPREIVIDLKINASLPAGYIPDDRQRIAIYRRLNQLSSREAIEDLKKELIDRFGALPEAANQLFGIVGLKAKAIKAGIIAIEEKGDKIYFTYVNGKRKYVAVKGKDKIKLVLRSLSPALPAICELREARFQAHHPQFHK